jgi:hypothetical protein
MNTYHITCYGTVLGRTTVRATNIHTAIKKLLYPTEGRLPRRAFTIKKGEEITIKVERIV